MRLVKVSAPQGRGADIANIAFSCGIEDVTIQQAVRVKPGSEPSPHELVDMKVSTLKAKAFIDALLDAPFFNRDDYAVDIREPRSILKREATREITYPLAATVLDVDEELWQFTHITYSFVARVMIAALLLSYGLIHDNPLFMIGGLVFLPFMPLVLGFSFGALTQQWSLSARAVAAYVVAILLITAAGAVLGFVADAPMEFDKFPPLAAGVAFSLIVGIAAAFGTIDDVGHRQLIGLAAASQLALVPAWIGISLVQGFDENPGEKLAGFGLNTVALALGCLAVYGALSWAGELSHHGARRKEHEL